MKTPIYKLQRLCLLGLILLFSSKMNSQELPSVIPPSPNAAAFHVYGNTQVNYYTGSANITIPLWEVKEGDLSVPIYLKYTGGNGIKVEEMASWVGLGWSLNAGGAISRTIRGIADDVPLKGFFATTGIPIPNGSNFSVFDDIEDGKLDSQPDMFMYNSPGSSGSFFYDYDENIHYKPKANVSITHTIASDYDPNQPSQCTTSHNVIDEFTLKDPYGNSYKFKDKEWSNTVSYNETMVEFRGFPSSWFLRKIENRIKTKSIDFEYDKYNYELKRSRSTIQVVNGLEDDVYTTTHYIGKRLKKITHSQGSVEFVASTAVRKDFNDTTNKYLDKIIVKDSNGNTIKTIKFNYQYMTPTGLVALTATIPNYDESRLVLTSIEECDGDNNCLNPTSFTYNTDKYLPSRFSKAQDHWGYYNGAITNTKLEPRQVIKWYNPSINDWDTDDVGSANRAPDPTYAVAGILKEVEYPTGGKTVFEYEGHTAKTYDVAGVITNLSEVLTTSGQTNSKTFTVDLPTNATIQSVLKVTGHHNECTPTIKIKNLSTNVVTNMSLPPGSQGGSSTYINKFTIATGSYEAWYEISSCSETISFIKLSWENEDSSPTRNIGGLRLKNISDYSATSTLATKRHFNYMENDTTSGRVVNVPVYYGLEYSVYDDTVPLGFLRYVNSITPLATTQGSHVGYGKVTITNDNDANGKEEHYFTTMDDFPDNYSGINPDTGELNHKYYDGVKIYPYPPPETDSKDFLRGILKKQILYKKSGSTFSKVYQKEVSYNSLNYSNEPIESFSYIKTAATAVRGLKIATSRFTYYDIYTGYNVPSTTIETYYNASGDVVKMTTQKYDEDSNNLIDYYIPTSVEVTGSDDIISKTNTTYVFNKGSKTTAETDLYNKKAWYIPLQTESYKNTELLGKQYTVYSNSNSNWSGLNLPEKIQTAKGSGSLEDRIIYNDYDVEGNPTEVSKKDGTHITYIYGYNESLPIAKIENATTSELTTAIGTLNSNYNTLAEIQSLSDADVNGTTEKDLRTALDDLRAALPNAFMTSFTYDPLIGVTSVTDPRGKTSYYYYDNHARLQYVKDHDGKILSKTEYNYKN
ncbi:hypothetical protein [Pontimicrobium sp. SW4]|uniref:RHS repeat protein n=1 Tax=Pontimicrobium sp. SW4 TaxID=3153519 RepID=A0AAU7BS04_9FLAO